MRFIQTRDIAELERFEGINGGKIPKQDIEYLAKFFQANGAVCVAIPEHAIEFSKPKRFFLNLQRKLVFLKNGVVVPYCVVEVDNQNFIAYQKNNQKLYIYAYFLGDYD